MKVYFANENPGNVRAEFMRSTFELVYNDMNTDKHVHIVDLHHGGAGVAMFRNQTIEKMLSTEAEAIFFVDSDIKLELDTLSRLAANLHPTERPVISGLYFQAIEDGLRPVMFKLGEPQENGNRHMEYWDRLPEVDGLYEVDGIGAGCVLMHRQLLEEMLMEYGTPVPWFADEVWHGEMYGEDLAFSRRVIETMHRKIYVDTEAAVGHVKPICLTKQGFLAQQSYYDANPNAAAKEMETV